MYFWVMWSNDFTKSTLKTHLYKTEKYYQYPYIM